MRVNDILHKPLYLVIDRLQSPLHGQRDKIRFIIFVIHFFSDIPIPTYVPWIKYKKILRNYNNTVGLGRLRVKGTDQKI